MLPSASEFARRRLAAARFVGSPGSLWRRSPPPNPSPIEGEGYTNRLRRPLLTLWKALNTCGGVSGSQRAEAFEEGFDRPLYRAAQYRLIGEQFEFGPFVGKPDCRSDSDAAPEQPFGQRRGTRA